MRRSKLSLLSLTAATLALGAAACSDPIAAPRDLSPSIPSAALGSQPIPLGATSNPLASNASVSYCGHADGVFNPSFGGTTFVGGCVAASDLTASLAAYNPGWGAPLGTSSWIGSSPTANQYTVVPGTYDFRTTFTLPAGATSPLLNLSTLADNVAQVYLNGHLVGANTPIQDCPAGGPCNWETSSRLDMFDNTAADFNVGGTNTIDIFLINTMVGQGPPGSPAPPNWNTHSCADGPQPFGTGPNGVLVPTPQSLATGWDPATCLNPAGLDFTGTVSFNPAPPPHAVALFVIGDVEAHNIGANVNFWGAQWWKNNTMSGVVSPGVASFKGYATTSDNVCGGTWQSLPGNSSNPPDAIPADVAIIVTSKVIKNGPNISGDIKQIVMVHQDGGYGPNPGHAGNGPVISIVCTR
jgi:hypothetical protein